jgi:hypothetical protein
MNLKTKALGLFVAVAFAVGVGGGASAAPQPTTVLLLNNPLGLCLAVATGVTVDFGTYTYNGGGYTAPGTTPTFNLLITQTLNPTSHCNVDVSASAMTFLLVNTIPASALSLDATPAGTTVPSMSSTDAALFTNVASGTYPVKAAISTAALTSLPTGAYLGTMTFTATTAP